jgi:hypothetical protein
MSVKKTNWNDLLHALSATQSRLLEILQRDMQTFEEAMEKVGDDAQLGNIDMQNILQKQQQTLQMMSNVSKMLHDTTMAIVRRVGS